MNVKIALIGSISILCLALLISYDAHLTRQAVLNATTCDQIAAIKGRVIADECHK